MHFDQYSNFDYKQYTDIYNIILNTRELGVYLDDIFICFCICNIFSANLTEAREDNLLHAYLDFNFFQPKPQLVLAKVVATNLYILRSTYLNIS